MATNSTTTTRVCESFRSEGTHQRAAQFPGEAFHLTRSASWLEDRRGPILDGARVRATELAGRAYHGAPRPATLSPTAPIALTGAQLGACF